MPTYPADMKSKDQGSRVRYPPHPHGSSWVPEFDRLTGFRMDLSGYGYRVEARVCHGAIRLPLSTVLYHTAIT
jgi:hypothetical protein